MTIRLANLDDVPMLVVLYRSFFEEDGILDSDDGIEKNLLGMMSDLRARVFVAVENGQVIGFSSGTLTFGVEFGCSAELEDLYVVPSKRGAGWAKLLAKAVLEWASIEGANEVFLVITPEAERDQSLTAFYKKLGFENSNRMTMIRPK